MNNYNLIPKKILQLLDYTECNFKVVKRFRKATYTRVPDDEMYVNAKTIIEEFIKSNNLELVALLTEIGREQVPMSYLYAKGFNTELQCVCQDHIAIINETESKVAVSIMIDTNMLLDDGVRNIVNSYIGIGYTISKMQTQNEGIEIEEILVSGNKLIFGAGMSISEIYHLYSFVIK